MGQVSLTSAALKASRLARLLNDFDFQKIMKYEASGYPVGADGILDSEAWELAVLAGRRYESVDSQTKKQQEYVYVESISALEKDIEIAEASLAAATTHPVQAQYLGAPFECV